MKILLSGYWIIVMYSTSRRVIRRFEVRKNTRKYSDMEITMKQQQQQSNLQERNYPSNIKRFLVISNICKGNNIRTLCKAANAYGFSIIFVGAIQTNITLVDAIEYITLTDLKV